MAEVTYVVKLKDLASPELQKLINQSNKLTNSIDNVNKKGSMIGDFVKGSLITQGIGMVTGAMGGMIEKTIDATAEYQKFQAVLSTTLGSEAMANESMKMIQAFADITNFSSTELTDSFIKLANRNVVLKTDELMNMADVANATGKSFEQLTEAILDINNSERWKEIGIKSKVAGDKVQLSWKGVTKEVANTELGVKNAILEFGKMKGVAGMTDKVNKTVGGQISTLKDTWNGVFLDIGKSSNTAIMGMIEALSTALTDFRDSGVIDSFATKIGDSYKFLLQNAETIRSVVVNIGEALIAIGAGLSVFALRLGIIKALTLINSALTFEYGLQWAFVSITFNRWVASTIPGFGIVNGALTITNGLMAGLTLGLPLLIAGMTYLFVHFKGLWENIKIGASNVMKIIENLFKMLKSPLSFNFKDLTKGLDEYVDFRTGEKKIKYEGAGIGYKGFGAEMGTGFAKAIAPTFLEKPKEGTKAWYEANKTEKETKIQIEKPKAVKELGVKGSSVGRETKIVNINIGSLVKDMAITVSDLKTGVQNIREEVAKALIGAVNDTKTI